MAVGDVVSDVVSVPAGSNFQFQPAAGVEIMLSFAGGGSAEVFMRNATISSRISNAGLNEITQGVGMGRTNSANSMYGSISDKFFINNTNFLRMYNPHATETKNFMYCGVQIK